MIRPGNSFANDKERKFCKKRKRGGWGGVGLTSFKCIINYLSALLNIIHHQNVHTRLFFISIESMIHSFGSKINYEHMITK